jgi:proteasome lid subunit RPN8/RPN11
LPETFQQCIGVTSIPPVRITVDRRALITLARVFTAALPWEGCALLLGRTGRCPHLQRIWPCLNSWPERSARHRRFALDPREQLQAQRWCRQHGLAVIAAAHSHPSGEPVPSALDRQLVLAPDLLLIAAPVAAPGAAALGGAPDAGAFGWQWAFWWIAEAEETGQSGVATPLPWTMAD